MVSNIKVRYFKALSVVSRSRVQLILAVVVVYKMTVTLIKLSILMIYLKLGKSIALHPRPLLTCHSCN
jgi:hypothetical protein